MMDTSDNIIKKTGLFGGTFDPVHWGHLIVAEQVRENFGLDEIMFIPSGEPPHKTGYRVTEGAKRIEMLRLATKTNSFFSVLDLEVNRKGPTYTIDTLNELINMYENRKFYFIIGADVVFDLLTWKRYQDVFGLCEFIAVIRSGFLDENFNDRIKYLKENHNARIHVVECPLVEVSSSYTRKRVYEGRSIKYLVPENVEDYIRVNNLYKGD